MPQTFPGQHHIGISGARVSESDTEGRYLVASHDLSEDHIIYDGRAYAAAIYDEFVEHVCACCFKVAREGMTSHTCEKCHRVFYCSDACRRQHADQAVPGTVPHRHVCAALQKLDRLEQMGSLIKARMIIEVLARQYAQLPLSDAAEDEADDLARLLCHVPSCGWTFDEQSDAWLGALRDAIGACAWAANVPLAELSDEALLSTVDKIDTNGFDCKTLATGGESIGIGLYLQGVTLLNHACAPNCMIVHNLPALVVRTIRCVTAHEPLTIAYVDVTADRATRRERLAADYNFECACDRCVVEAELEAGDRYVVANAQVGRVADQPGGGNSTRTGVLLRIALCLLTASAVGTGYWVTATLTLFAYVWSVWHGE